MKLNEELNVFKDARSESRIPISTFIENAQLVGSDKKLIESSIKTIYVIGFLSEKTTSIRSYKDENYNYESIIVLHFKLKNNKSIAQVNELIQKAFPSPVITIYEYESTYYLSTSLKRINKLDESKVVIEDIAIEPIAITDLDLQSFNSVNLKSFYESIHQYVYKLAVKNITGFLPQGNKDYKKIISHMQELEFKLTSLKAQYKKETMKAKKIKMDDDIYDVEEELKRTIKQL